jgi:DNA-binding response OmpR family regulator
MGPLISLGSLLDLEGYRVITCSTSDQALRAVKLQRPDLVIAGRVGPELHAVLASKIKGLSPKTSVLLLTESRDHAMTARALAAGADGLLSRPYSERQVLEQVNRLLSPILT